MIELKALMVEKMRTSPPWSPARHVLKGEKVWATPARNLPLTSSIHWWIRPAERDEWDQDAESPCGVGVGFEDLVFPKPGTGQCPEFDTFFSAYLEAALWSSTDDEGTPLEDLAGFENLEESTLRFMRLDAWDFFYRAVPLIARSTNSLELAGHDFWLTRTGHGAGFWDGDWEDELARPLTSMSERLGELTLFFDRDSRKVYCDHS